MSPPWACVSHVHVPACACSPCMPLVCISSIYMSPRVYPLRSYISFVCTSPQAYITPFVCSLRMYAAPYVSICQPSSSHHKIFPCIANFSGDRFHTATAPFGEDGGVLLRVFSGTKTRVIDEAILFHHVQSPRRAASLQIISIMGR